MRRKIGEILVARGVVTAQDVDDALADQSAGDPSRLGDILIAAGKLTPVQLAQGLAEQAGVPYTELPQLTSAVLEAVPLDFQRAHKLVPISVEGDVLSVAMADLSDADAVTLLKASWPEVRVFATGADEVDALHAALVGDLAGAPDAAPATTRLPVTSTGSSPSIDELFGSLNLDADEPAPPPPNAPLTASGLFGDLDLDNVRPLGSATSARVDLEPLTAVTPEPPALLEAELVSPVEPDEALVFESPPASLQPPPSAPRRSPSAPRRSPSAPRPAPSAPRPAPSAPRPAPSAPRPAPSAPRPAPPAPVSGPSVLTQLLEEHGGAASAASPDQAPRPPAPSAPPRRPLAPPRAAPSAPLAAAAEARSAGALDLPDWLRGDTAGAPSSTPDAPTERWTGELEVLAPSKLIAGVARALIRKGLISERDVLDALELKKA